MFDVLLQGCLSQWVGMVVTCKMVGGHSLTGTLRAFGASPILYVLESTTGSGANQVPLFTLIRSAHIVAMQFPPGVPP
jgi:hypothetical protein